MKRRRKVDKLKVASAVVSLAIAGALMFGITSVINNVKQNSRSKYNVVDLGENNTQAETSPSQEQTKDWSDYQNQMSQDDERTMTLTPSQPQENPTVAVEQPPTQEEPQAVVAPSGASAQFSFSENDILTWPVQGDLILPYSMDATIYYKTLGLYKCNPSISIASKVGTEVKASASGMVKDVYENEETGLTLVMDIGNGYTLTYGQLAQVSYKKGAAVMAGDVIGTVAEPTVYYTKEGANLYMAMEKDGESVDPTLFLTE